MADFVKVADLSEVPPGEMLLVDLEGEEIALANVNGTIYAFDDTCTHMGGPLGEGELDGTTVTCPWHSGEFDVTTGEVKGPPPDDPEPKYEVRVEGDEVQVAAG